MSFCNCRILPLFLALLLVCPAGVAVAADDAKAERRQKLIEEMEAYYARLYAQPLTLKARLPKLLALMSLSRIDSKPTTLVVVEAAGSNDLIVSYLAWEILHARQKSLESTHYNYWVKRGLELGSQGALPGTLLLPALEAARSVPHDAVRAPAEKLFDHITANYSPDRKADLPVLAAAGRLLKAWNDSGLTDRVSGQRNDKSRAAAAEQILSAVADARGKGASATATTQPYTSVSKIIPPPGRITDPDDPQWRKDLELGKLAISNFELAWVMDSTGSMNEPNQVVASQTARVSRILSLVSDKTRIGAVYFRHEVDPKLQVRCCAAAGTGAAYQTKAHALNADAFKLAATMAAEPIPKPDKALRNTHPGSAVHGGLITAIKRLAWSKDPNSRRVIMLIGDSPLTTGTDEETVALAAEAVQNGFQIHALTIREAREKWKPVIDSAKGLMFDFTGAGQGKRRKPKTDEDAIPRVDDFAVVARLVVKAAISPQYHDRVDPLFDALMPYVEQQAAHEGEKD